ncbi:putative nucleotidyltransferase substrate binding domain-containing protein [Ornithinimicrobium pratense]|uniref:Cyclic nucleotide-binding/CBS domain-containing protein n=1 Tax=Ornithinimicrobium pratense TaxID=2593973 RepID=A0A5J6V690_9MICO|nr:putative nucleotidyltransferase substrate binding domain-containing protein [Ornithinimicrobium pratense]QFG69409.1 cyclic nucleotide-binding/CBS domain-containing protein [Ornithinimicrobium pratense]
MDVELAEIRDFLAQHPPFDVLPEQVLDALPRRCTLSYARRGATVLRAGSRNDRLFVVRSGAVDITDEGQLVDRVGAGGAFGMSSVVEHVPTRYQVTAREDTLLIQLPQDAFDELTTAHPAVAAHFAGTHHDRIRTAIGQLQAPSRGSSVLRTAVRDMIRAEPVRSGPEVTIAQAAQEMTRAGVSSLLIMRGEELLGIVTDRDLRRRVLAAGIAPDRPVAEVMTPDPITVGAEALALEVLLEMTGRNIHHLPVRDGSGRILGLVTTTDLVRLERSNPVYLVADISGQTDVVGVVEQARRIPSVVEQLVAEDASAEDIGRVTTALADAVVVRLLELTVAELRDAGHGEAPGRYTWVWLGSAAREEMGLGGDQDHALVLADDTDPHDPWWALLAERVTEGLEAAGLPPCGGDIMASNPRWRMTVSQWRSQFARWSHEPEPNAVLWAAIFYDMRCVFGEPALVEGLREEVVPMGGRSDLLVAYLAGQASRMRPPIGFFRGFVLEDAGEHRDTLDIKRGVTAVVQLARVHAVRAGSRALGTRLRLEAAAAGGGLSAQTATDLADAFELMSYLRVRHQARQVRAGQRPDNHLNPEDLGSLDRRHLRDAFQIVRSAQQALGARLPRVG